MQRRLLTRRTLLLDAGRVTIGAVVLGAAACRGTADPDPDAAAGTEAAPTPEPSDTSAAPTPVGTSEATASWRRVDLDFVSAYVLVRAGEAVLVDTGIGGSSAAIGGVLQSAGAGWEDLAEVILTHRHPDHAGSVAEVVELAPEATVRIGRGDLEAIASVVAAEAVDDGDTVAGLRIVGTPGHTPGHVAVLDPQLGVLLAGDAINGADGTTVLGPNEQFTQDMQTATASVRVLAGLTFDTVLFGHGEPLASGASQAVAALADDLGV